MSIKFIHFQAKNYNNIALPLTIAAICFLALGGIRALNPLDISWIPLGDPTQHYLGWEFFRKTVWTIPPGLNPGFGLDISSSIVYSDSIPLMAIILKIFSGYLPDTFQYLGIWYLICFLMQGLMGWKISTLLSDGTVDRCLITTIFIFTPAFLCIVNITAALSSHFLILAAIYLALGEKDAHRGFYWGLLIVVATYVHFYLLAMVAFIWLASSFDSLLHRDITFKQLVQEIIITCLIVAIGAWLIGYFSTSTSSIHGDGYGDVSNKLNPLAIFFDRQWSYLESALPQFIPKDGSNNFLGLGLILAFIYLIFESLTNFRFIFQRISKHPIVLASLIFLFFFSITNRITIGNINFYYQLPDFYLNYANILRGSTRLFWPVYYFLITLILYSITKGSLKKYSTTLLLICLLVQIIDMKIGLNNLRNDFASRKYERLDSDLKSIFWDNFAKQYSYVALIPEVSKRVNFEVFATYANRNRMETNSALLARPDLRKVAQANLNFDLAIRAGSYKRDTLYVIDDDLVIPTSTSLNRSKDAFIRIDGFNVLAPGWLECKECVKPPNEILITTPPLPIPQIDTKFTFSKDGSGTKFLIGIGQFERLGWGWSYPESWGVWSEGRQSKLLIPLPGHTKPKSITLIAKAFISPAHPTQRVEICINHQPCNAVYLTRPDDNIIHIPLPQDSMRNFALIDMHYPDAISPKKLGTGDDIRKLAIGLISGELK